MNISLPPELDLDSLAKGLGLTTQAAKESLTIALENVLLIDKKQQDYGPRNISGFGTFGVIVRMNDKFERLKTIFGKGKSRRARNESVIDTFRDLSNYAIIAHLVHTDKWPKE